ncbi:MAG: GTPase HflX [Lentimicrobiaceae bacterium]|nr:GTPase HflX [Lentimicrobiaceae bacterium]MCO5265214.1 GTPase HflX [Lentimicrobium sp.]HPG32281.1 GTPase HflX [Lentimicrobium sp.]
MFNTSPEIETAVLVGLITNRQDETLVNETLDELDFLLETAGGLSVKRFVQKLDKPDSRTFVGSGKLEEISAFIKAEKVATVVFDDELSPSQLRNIERELGCKVLDRTTLILDIFAKRARTATARTQVELAQLQYLLPRLSRMWTHLEKQRGGIGMRGPGEKEIETDRRIIRDKISLLKEKLKDIDKQKVTQRSGREKLVRVALIGYTNVGKSTLMNLLSKSEVFAENKLFATLDTTVRKMVIDNLPFLLTDTVGFIRKLPHSLVESFKSTLDEVREADLLLHVVDISHPGFEDQIEVVNQTLADIKASDKPVMMVFNKVDAYSFVEKEESDLSPATRENITLDELKRTWIAKVNNPAQFISATKKLHIDEFRSALYTAIRDIHVVRYPYNKLLY